MSQSTKARILFSVFLAAIILMAAAPVLVALLAFAIANLHGCELSMGTQEACMIAGADWSTTLLSWSLAPWFLFYTLPFGFLLLVIWLVVFLVHRIRSRSRHPA